VKSFLESLRLIAKNLLPAKKTVTKIIITSRDNTVTVRLDFQPKLDPKNITFDQAAGAAGVQAIKKFINEHTDQDPSVN
jgi:hypothetical protein